MKKQAGVAELADAYDSKSYDGNIMRVRFPPPAQNKKIIFYPIAVIPAKAIF